MPRETDIRPTRRSWLKSAAAASGAALLSGCGSNNTSGDEVTIPEETDETFVTTGARSVNNVNFNPYNQLSFPNQCIYYLFNSLFWWSQTSGERLPRLGTSYTRDGDTLTIELDDRYTWHNGDPVTADDVLVRLTLDKLAELRNWNQVIDDCYADGEYTVVIELVEDANEELTWDLLKMSGVHMVCTHPDVYSQFLPDDGSRGKDAYADLSTFERKQLQGDLLSFTVDTAPPNAEDQGTAPIIGNGPWRIVSKGNREMVFEPFEEYPFADDINFPKVKFLEIGTNQARYQSLLSDNLSGLDLVLTNTVYEQLPDYYEEYTYERRIGHGLAINYQRFPDHRVRQALALALDKPQIVKNAGLPEKLASPHEFDSALYVDRARHEKLFGEGFVDKLTRYEQDTDRAAELLRDAGWSRDDGQWYDENDEKVQIRIKAPPTWSEYVNMIQTTTQQLSDFGIESDFKTEELVVYYAQTMIQADYDMAHWFAGSARDFPWFAYDTIWNALPTIADNHKHPAVYEEVPGPMGEHNGDDTMTINVQQNLKELAQTRTGTERAKQLRRELAWTYNQMLPVYCIHEETGLATLDGRNWDGPEPDAARVNTFWPLHQAHNQCEIQATDY